MANHALNTYFIKHGFTKVEAVTTESVYYKHSEYLIDVRVSDHTKTEHRGEGKLDIIIPSNGFIIKGKTPKHNKPLYTVLYRGMTQILDYGGLTAFLDSFIFMRKVQTFEARRMAALAEYNKKMGYTQSQKKEVTECKSVKSAASETKEPITCASIDPTKKYTHAEFYSLVNKMLTAKQATALTTAPFVEFTKHQSWTSTHIKRKFGKFIDEHNWVAMLDAMDENELNVFINGNAVKSMFRQVENAGAL